MEGGDLLKIEKDVFCCIVCMDIVKDASEFDCCNTLICSKCLILHQKNFKTCPMCRKDQPKTRPSFVLRKIIGSILTKCPLNCGEIKKMSDIKMHILDKHANECDFNVNKNLIEEYNVRIYEDKFDYEKTILYHKHTLYKVPIYSGWNCIGKVLFKNKNCLEGDTDTTTMYHCLECNYNMCSNCVTVKMTDGFDVQPHHCHPLMYIERDNGWGCDGRKAFMTCKSGINSFGVSHGFKRFRCNDCDFDFCEKCLIFALQNNN